MKKKFFKTNGILILLIAVVLTLLAGLYSAMFGSKASFVTNAWGIVTTPVQKLVSEFTSWAGHIYSYTYEFDTLKKENQELKQQIADMQEKVRDGEASTAENERFRTLLNLQKKRRDFTFENAAIADRGSSNWSSTLTLGKGAANGVKVDNCVVNAAGDLVGIVTQVGTNWCTVITVTDPGLELGGTILRTSETAILEGSLELLKSGRLKLSYLSEQSDVVNGDLVITSGKGGVYPSGLVVGYVENVRNDVSGATRYAVLSPAADLRNLTEVFIIKSFDIVE
ncbi:MAG: rod shape-determining protein MreC [Oscillospiraceae bacterium]|nr:rod shape-determining protein MreC [Oscillospiraceae bacterium]